MWIISSSSCLFFTEFLFPFLSLGIFHVRGIPQASWGGCFCYGIVDWKLSVHEWGLLTDGLPCGVTGGNLGIYEELTVKFFFSLSQSVFLLRTPWISCGRVFGCNKLESSIQKPSLERAGSFTIGCADFYFLFSVKYPISVLSYGRCSWVWGLWFSLSRKSSVVWRKSSCLTLWLRWKNLRVLLLF